MLSTGKDRLDSARKGEAHRFLAITMGISLSLHASLFWLLSSVPMFEGLTVSDVTFQDLPNPAPRNIPRPRSTHKEVSSLDDLKDIKSFRIPAIPPTDPMKQDSGRNSQGAAFAVMTDGKDDGEGIAIPVPAVPSVGVVGPGAGIGQWNPGSIGGMGATDYSSPRNYLEMVRLRIEKHKQYPSQARMAHMEGRVIVRFTIASDGGLRSVDVWKSSNKKALDEAALQAVRSAAPFPVPPRHLFKDVIPLELAIIFELT